MVEVHNQRIFSPMTDFSITSEVAINFVILRETVDIFVHF